MRIGVLGGGQLGRMLALAAYPLGIGVRCFDTSPEATAGLVTQLRVGGFDDREALADFSGGLDVITYEFENVSLEAACWLEERMPVYPPPMALRVAQDRWLEKEFFQAHGVPIPDVWRIDTKADLAATAVQLHDPAILKSRRFGYDGKGQVVVRRASDLPAAWEQLGRVPATLERFLDFDRELSLIAVRGLNGETAFYPLVENHHRAGVLRLSLAPALGVTARLQREAEDYLRRLLDALGYVGVLAVEFFQVGDKLLANEMAPRVHNSGHWTIEGAETSQFENHIRAVAGLPLGSTAPRGMSAMVNLIGSVPDRNAILAIPGAHLHDYQKPSRPGRKVGHVTIRADDPASLGDVIERVRKLADSAEAATPS